MLTPIAINMIGKTLRHSFTKSQRLSIKGKNAFTNRPYSLLTLVEHNNLFPLTNAAWALSGPLVCCSSIAARPASPAPWAVVPARHAVPFRIPGQEHGKHLASPTCTSGKRKPSFHARPSACMAACASASSSRPIQAAYSPAALRGEPSNRVGFKPPGRRRCMAQAKAECERKFLSPELPSHVQMKGPSTHEQTSQGRQAHMQARTVAFFAPHIVQAIPYLKSVHLNWS